jgi:hypothetical protein
MKPVKTDAKALMVIGTLMLHIDRKIVEREREESNRM